MPKIGLTPKTNPVVVIDPYGWPGKIYPYRKRSAAEVTRDEQMHPVRKISADEDPTDEGPPAAKRAPKSMLRKLGIHKSSTPSKLLRLCSKSLVEFPAPPLEVRDERIGE